MRRSRCGRILTGLLTLWLALTQSDIAVLHAWPAQGRAHAAASAPCPSHSAMLQQHDGHDSPMSHDDTQRCCCCCACVAPAAITSPAAVVALVPSARLVVVPPTAPAVIEYRHTAPAHARPPSQGPPALPDYLRAA